MRKFIALILLFLCFQINECTADIISIKAYKEAISYLETHAVTDLDIGTVRMKPLELLSILHAMPVGSSLHFITKWNGITVCSEDTELNLRDASYKDYTVEDIEALIELMPNLTKIDVSNNRKFSSKIMIPLVEKYPKISFNWLIILNSTHSLSTWSTAYSSYNEPNDENKLTSEQLEMLKYAQNLKALDLGHNAITSLDFLEYLPDLELLILGDNPIEDGTPISKLKHLKYLELFSVKISDVSFLSNCTEMIDLNLSHNKEITDLTALDNMLLLERFWGNRMTGINKEEEARFVSAHPTTKIVFHGAHATSDGWREHERYDHYRWCFRHHKWIPFGEKME